MAYYNEKIKELRRNHNLTLKDVAKKLGVTEATAQRYESAKGIKDIPYKKLLKYAELFGTTPSELMGWDKDFVNTENSTIIETFLLGTEKGAQLLELRNIAESLSESKLSQLINFARFLQNSEE